MKKWILLVNLLLPSWGLASGGVRIVGNGGDVLVCSNSIELLDHYEARTLRGMTIDFGVSQGTVQERIQVALRRLYRLSPDRAQLYGQWVNDFFSEVQFLEGVELVDIPDSQHIVIPKGCKIMQIANQATVLMPGQKRYSIDRDLWDRLNLDQRAGLIFHEIVYREALSLGHNHSVGARWLASLTASPILEQLTLKQFSELLVLLGFPTVRSQGALLELFYWKDGTKVIRPLEFYSGGNLKSAHVVDDSLFVLSNQSLRIRGPIEFFDNGYVDTLYLSRVQKFRLANLGNEPLLLSPQILRFHANGQLALGLIEIPLPLSIGNMDVMAFGHIQFYSNGMLELARINRGQWQSPWGPVSLFEMIRFYKNGNPMQLRVSEMSININDSLVKAQGDIEFYPDFRIKKLGHFKSRFQIKIQSKKIWVSQFSPMLFYGTGQVWRLSLGKDTRLRTVQGEQRWFGFGDKIHFSKEGLVLPE